MDTSFIIDEERYRKLFELSKASRANVYDALLLRFFSGLNSENLSTEELGVYKAILSINAKKAIRGKHLFIHSPYFTNDEGSIEGKKLYLQKIKEDISREDLNIDYGHYWYAMRDWSGQGNKKVNWLSTAASWIRRDISQGNVVLKKDNKKVVKHFNHKN